MDETTIIRRRLNRNITIIKHTISPDIDLIIDKLIEKDVVTSENKEQLSSEPNRLKRVDELLRIIRSRGQRAFDIFMDILLFTRHHELHGTIMRTTIGSEYIIALSEEASNRSAFHKETYDRNHHEITDGKDTPSTPPSKYVESNLLLESKIGVMQQAMTTMATCFEKMDARFSKQEQAIISESKIDDMQQAITTMTSGFEKMDARYSKQEQAIDLLLKQNQESAKERENLKEENEQLKRELSFIKDDLKCLNATKSKEIAELDRECKELHSQIYNNPVIKNNSDLRRENARLRKVVKSLKGKVDDLRRNRDRKA